MSGPGPVPEWLWLILHQPGDGPVVRNCPRNAGRPRSPGRFPRPNLGPRDPDGPAGPSPGARASRSSRPPRPAAAAFWRRAPALSLSWAHTTTSHALDFGPGPGASSAAGDPRTTP